MAEYTWEGVLVRRVLYLPAQGRITCFWPKGVQQQRILDLDRKQVSWWLSYINVNTVQTNGKGKRIPRAIHVCPASYPQSTIFLHAGAMRATRAHRSKHAGDGNQFMGVVELPKGAIVESELTIVKKNNKYANESADRGRGSRTGQQRSI